MEQESKYRPVSSLSDCQFKVHILVEGTTVPGAKEKERRKKIYKKEKIEINKKINNKK